MCFTAPLQFSICDIYNMIIVLDGAALSISSSSFGKSGGGTQISASCVSYIPSFHSRHSILLYTSVLSQTCVMCIHCYRFEREVSKWDESGNDIVALAKEMCNMMVDMSDFTR